MTFKEMEQERIGELEKLLRHELYTTFRCIIVSDDIALLSQRLVQNNVCLEKTATWIRDDSYQSKSKVMYRCSHCDHWRTVPKGRQDDLNHLHYCNFCGSRMDGKKKGSQND